MKNRILLSIFVIMMFASISFAKSNNDKIESEILAFRSDIRQAVKAKDKQNLEKYFAENFTHTHASGKVDGKVERVAFFIKGEPTIEDVEPDEIRVNVINKTLATAIGKTTLLFGTEKRTFQWTGVFYKQKGKWQVVATHATLLKN